MGGDDVRRFLDYEWMEAARTTAPWSITTAPSTSDWMEAAKPTGPLSITAAPHIVEAAKTTAPWSITTAPQIVSIWMEATTSLVGLVAHESHNNNAGITKVSCVGATETFISILELGRYLIVFEPPILVLD